jgi:hypothetical protein
VFFGYKRYYDYINLKVILNFMYKKDLKYRYEYGAN